MASDESVVQEIILNKFSVQVVGEAVVGSNLNDF